ncbi:MAG TPA: threonine ammonia-lyase, partial [Chitinophagaceae bacterium]|nr:threonine ammonia-lyase [Chitinophagaceae bacterium]
MGPLSELAARLDIPAAAQRLAGIINRTPLQQNQNLSRKYHSRVYLKREDLQVVRSYKLRGAYNLMSTLEPAQLKKGVVCASAGNHAQGFAYSCQVLGIKGVVFMPIITSKQKVNQVKMFGGDHIEIRLTGDTFDDCSLVAREFTASHKMTFVPPFDDLRIIEGQGTVGPEILEDLQKVDYLFVPVGGGGLLSGIGSWFRTFSPATKIIGVEPEGAPSMLKAFEAGHPVTLDEIDRFVDGASVKRTGDISFEICRTVTDDIHLVAEGRVCSTILSLYNEDAIVAEPAGALSIAALEDFREEITGKNVV